MQPSTDAPPASGVPRHVAVIMDGNGRWAEARGLPRSAGHRAGIKAVRGVIEQSVRRGVGALTVFAFSSENWRRPQDEVGLLMQLFVEALHREVGELDENGVRLRVIGDRARLAPQLIDAIQAAEQRTAANTRLELFVAVSYGGRWDLLQAARSLAADAARGGLDPGAMDEAAIAGRLALAGAPDPDLFIRTGGERRLSNFLLWNVAYTELYFTDVLWPDFGPDEYDAAIGFFAGRERRFGRTSRQVGGAG